MSDKRPTREDIEDILRAVLVDGHPVPESLVASLATAILNEGWIDIRRSERRVVAPDEISRFLGGGS